MTIRFLADEDLYDAIVQGLRSRESAIDILDVKTAGLRGTKDPEILELAVQEDRLLITHDRSTMTRHFKERFKAGKPAPGVLVIPQQPSAIGEIIESRLLVWTASDPDEWRNQIVFFPFR